MKIGRFIFAAGFLAAAAHGFSQSSPSSLPASPPIVQAFPREASPIPKQGPQQQIYGPSGDTLIAREAANGVLEGFRKFYTIDGAPRVVIYVNRAVVETPRGPVGASEETSAHSPTASTNQGSPPLADLQAVREIERLFGRVFRHGGAQLVDHAVAASLLPKQPGTTLVGAEADEEREALAPVADLAIEVLISNRNLVVPDVPGEVTHSVPDIQATAIRLKDAVVIGQAAASDILERGERAGHRPRQFDAKDITEATALALIEDMLTPKK